MESRVYQIPGVEAIERALRDDADVRLILVATDAAGSDLKAVLERAQRLGISVQSVSRRVLTRLSVEGPADALALVGRDPIAGIDEMIAAGGATWLLVGVAYPGNVGMVVRTVEVSGGVGIVVDAKFDGEGRKAALRASMRADKFMPVHWAPPWRILECAEAVGHSIYAIDEAGEHGIAPAVLEHCHARIRIPMAGFIPCYNLQAAVSAIATERLRQLQLART
jgi:tRNA G18 (ribose-2'-O)-methylase SpoU